MIRRDLALSLLVLCFLVTAQGAPAYKVESIGACASAELSDAVKASLQSQGYRISGDSGPLCEIWPSKVIAQRAGASGADYSTLANGTFAGVISYISRGGDYRGQPIKVGTYTFRYQTIPSDGNHLGVSQTSDFFLLVPAALDKDPAALIEYQELIKLGKQGSGSNHAYPLNLLPPSGGGATSFQNVDEGHWVLEFKTKAKAAGGASEVDFPIALILIGKSEG